MTTITEQKIAHVRAPAKALALLMLGFLGVLLVGGVGFAGIPAVHNAAHDVRHTLSFPCH
ncbi:MULTISPECIES: CbtB domain-containing protein [Agrobacterium]|jgi:cobalt transporter subunit CbtB|uniref:CbtB domain-containing protein n=1 Tax=Agrobacterium TaxID=357 RepID=UPI00035EA7C0|nr:MULTISPECIES: CbtB domain-containing protein [Agrobacterium]MBM7324106.1 CbtB-domain containing protein [Agrobacterium sp. S2]MDP9734577.1 cobalt transporter subunit CbtB [Rhizobium sp. SORGH_AS_0285]MDP9756794.1 cobalt transporter subunit CbtB [Rhizobium sp. SORGH_AS_0260]EPR23388.1 cobalt transporter subunit CbtB [Agrobacterium radiobacter DSM 30147]KAB0459362.1 cobalt transporter subunit CbtB [Agrobacterium tumefaciens]